VPPALSPEFDARLRAEFPPGSRGEQLLGAFERQGFGAASQCDDDSSIRFVTFRQRGGSLFFHPIWAQAFWKVDDANRIVWTKGFVVYTGL
jgi:hypothetical protein